MRIAVCFAALMAVAAAQGLGAQGSAEADAAAAVGKVDISAEAWSPVLVAQAGSVEVVGSDQIEAAGAQTAADALQLAAGAFVNRAGPGSATASITLRGSSSAQVLVIVDGVRQNDARQGAPDLSTIPAVQIEKIEVLKGGASAVYGADAVGGVILITTKRPSPGKYSLSLSNVSYPTAGKASSLVDGQSLGMEAGAKIGDAELTIRGQGDRATGAFPYDSTLSSPALQSDNAFIGGSGNASFRTALGGGEARASIAGAYRDTGVPGTPQYHSPRADQKNASFDGDLGWASDNLLSGAMRLDFLAYGKWSRIAMKDPTPPSYYVGDPQTPIDSRHDSTIFGFEARNDWELLSWMSLGFGFSGSYESADSTSFETSADGQPTRRSIGGYAEPHILIGDRLKVEPALRYDWNDNFVAGLSELLGIVWKALPELDVRAFGGRSYRAPTFNDLYWPFDPVNYYQGNPDLKPETAWSLELGADLHYEGLSASASAFARRIDDQIVYYSDPVTYIGTMKNINKTFVPGFDASASYELGPVKVEGAYEFINPLDLSNASSLSDAEPLKNQSRSKAKASVTYRDETYEAGIGGRYWSERSFSTTSSLPAVLLLEAHGSIRLEKRIRLSMAIDNLLNKEYEVNAGYPMPGLSLTTKLRVDF